LVLLPRSKVTVCLNPGETLTMDEIAELDEWFLAAQAARAGEREG
jgi:hypothetical protein